jgi:hypothetical protein
VRVKSLSVFEVRARVPCANHPYYARFSLDVE